MDNYWIFKHFHNEHGVDLIQAWLGGLSPEDLAKVNTRFAYLAAIKDKSAWRRPFAAKLRGMPKGSSIWEIRIDGDGVLYRPLGCFGPKEDEYTVLIDAIERGKGVFEPRRAPDIAVRRCKLIHQDRRYVGG
jgi:hypothetical protein